MGVLDARANTTQALQSHPETLTCAMDAGCLLTEEGPLYANPISHAPQSWLFEDSTRLTCMAEWYGWYMAWFYDLRDSAQASGRRGCVAAVCLVL